ncbi:MAG TPA: EF-hand domain-containing protein [Gammaproteobacteria bacterium]|nr:EF-hand domain-containing protein [Gammaproteobacteria bacterium]
MRVRLSFVSALTLLIGTAVWAQAQFTPPTFDGIDKDKSGKLSKEEVAAWVKTLPPGPNGPRNADEVFARWDTNKDGSVSKEEFDARPRGGQGQGPGGGAGGGPPTTK